MCLGYGLLAHTTYWRSRAIIGFRCLRKHNLHLFNHCPQVRLTRTLLTSKLSFTLLIRCGKSCVETCTLAWYLSHWSLITGHCRPHPRAERLLAEVFQSHPSRASKKNNVQLPPPRTSKCGKCARDHIFANLHSFCGCFPMTIPKSEGLAS